MCGIVGVLGNEQVAGRIVEALKRLEYRGYDSAGLAVLSDAGKVERVRTVGKVKALAEALVLAPLSGQLGIAHTRWATHGVPSERNAHPHISRDGIAVVHNGIIENHEELRAELTHLGYVFTSETDTEVVAHRIHYHRARLGELFKAVRATVAELEGAYALAVIDQSEPNKIVTARAGCPVVVGVGQGENFIASDVVALLPVTRRFMFLEEGDVAEVSRGGVHVIDHEGKLVERPVRESEMSSEAAEKGQFQHFMLKEIHEQARAVANTLQERIAGGRLLEQAFGPSANEIFKRVRAVQIVACGTSYHAGCVARHYIEQYCRIPCNVEIASEFRYRNPVVTPDTLFVTISQSGETADTLAALRLAKQIGYVATLTICNVPESMMVRESDLVMLTRAGPEIGVASTKAFTTQLTALAMLTVALAKHNGADTESERALVHQLVELPGLLEKTLQLDAAVHKLALNFAQKHHALFLGRGPLYAIAMEGALKLKEISYIHAEAYAAGELKHGPLALVDKYMPVIAIAPKDALIEKLKSNLQEVKARGGELHVIADQDTKLTDGEGLHVIRMPDHAGLLSPILHTIPLQLLAYHTALERGNDVDKPRNLAKSVTVE